MFLGELLASLALMALCLVTPLKPLLYGGQWILWHPTITVCSVQGATMSYNINYQQIACAS